MDGIVKKSIGRLEQIDLPALGLSSLVAKIDTGAYRSSLHCHYYEIKSETGTEVLHVQFEEGGDSFQFEDFEQSRVKSSNGTYEIRYVIRTQLAIGEHKHKTGFTLTDRSAMRYPVLIGRKFLRSKFLVDVEKTYLLSQPPV